MHIKINILVSRVLLIIFSVISLAFLVADNSDAAACPAPYSCAGSAICSAEGRVVIGYTCTSGVCCNFSGTTPTPTTAPPPSGSFTLTSSCSSVNLRTGPSSSYAVKTTIASGTSLTGDATVSGGSWSVSCPTSASGSSWYRITAISGRSVSSLYGVTYLYGATALFQKSSTGSTPTPTPRPACPYSCTGSSICSAEGRTVSGYYCSTGVCCDFSGSTPTPSSCTPGVAISGTDMCGGSSYTTCTAPPAVTASVSCNGTTPQINVSWTTPSYSNGDYDIRYRQVGGTFVNVCSPSRPAVITNYIYNGNSYEVQVRSHTSAGYDGPTSFGSATVTANCTSGPTPTPTPRPACPAPYQCVGSQTCTAEGRTVSGYYCPTTTTTQVCCNFDAPTNTPTPTPTPTPRPTSTPTPTTSSGGYSASCLAPTSNTCGKYTLRNPMGLNFGDPACTYTKNDLYSYLKQVDPSYADRWYYTIIPCESSYNPLSYYGNSTSGRGAWGLYQMNPNECKRYDSGNIDWRRQTTNAVNYNRNLAQNGRTWRYWECAKQWW